MQQLSLFDFGEQTPKPEKKNKASKSDMEHPDSEKENVAEPSDENSQQVVEDNLEPMVSQGAPAVQSTEQEVSNNEIHTEDVSTNEAITTENGNNITNVEENGNNGVQNQNARFEDSAASFTDSTDQLDNQVPAFPAGNLGDNYQPQSTLAEEDPGEQDLLKRAAPMFNEAHQAPQMGQLQGEQAFSQNSEMGNSKLKSHPSDMDSHGQSNTPKEDNLQNQNLNSEEVANADHAENFIFTNDQIGVKKVVVKTFKTFKTEAINLAPRPDDESIAQPPITKEERKPAGENSNLDTSFSPEEFVPTQEGQSDEILNKKVPHEVAGSHNELNDDAKLPEEMQKEIRIENGETVSFTNTGNELEYSIAQDEEQANIAPTGPRKPYYIEDQTVPIRKRGRKSFKEIDAEVDLINIPPDEELFQKQYYPISVVAKWFRVNNSLLRFWENEFKILKPKKNKKGDRFFRPEDVKNLQLIYYLLRQKKLTINGAIKHLKSYKEKTEVNMQLIQTLNDFKGFLLELRAGTEK